MIDRTRHKMMIAMTKEHWRSIDPQWKDDPELCHALGYEAGYNNAGIVSEGMIQARMQDEIDELRAAIEQTHDWDEVEALRASLREHMAEIQRLRAALEQAQPELEQAMTDAIIGGTGVMLGDKRIDPASIYRQPEPEQEQEPVAWVCYGSASDEKHTIDYQQEDIDAIPVGTMLYTAPRQWQGLTDDEITKAGHLNVEGERMLPYSFARAVEARLREKNT